VGTRCAFRAAMRSRASIAGHPLHPAAVAIPIGAFTIVLLADLAALAGGDAGAVRWGPTASFALGVGIVGALLAAGLGFIDYFKVTFSNAGFRLARLHMMFNLVAVGLMALSFWLRWSDPDGWCVPGFVASTVGFAILGASGYLGGEMVFKHKIGVVENADPEATELGKKDAR